MKTSKAVTYSYENNKSISLKQISERSNLAMEDLISLFEEEMHEMVEYDSFEYEDSKKDIHFFKGSQNLHRCHYKINLAETELGNITLTRKSPFEEDEMIIVEQALGALSVHLHNVAEV